MRVCVSVLHPRALPCRPSIASNMLENRSTCIPFPNKMGYDVDQRPRTNRNKENSPHGVDAESREREGK